MRLRGTPDTLSTSPTPFRSLPVLLTPCPFAHDDLQVTLLTAYPSLREVDRILTQTGEERVFSLRV